jgi:hypothetical protein
MATYKTDRKEIRIEIRLIDEDFPSSEEMDLRWKLKEEIEKRGIGLVNDTGAGAGRMDLFFEVNNINQVNESRERVKQLLQDYGVLERSNITVDDVYESRCEAETPDFHPGDCMSFRFGDGDYGALLVLARGNAGLDTDELFTLVGVLDYKDPNLPSMSIFKRRGWLIWTDKWWGGKPYTVWLHCYENAGIIEIGKVTLGENEPALCNFFLSWENIPEYILREKNKSP